MPRRVRRNKMNVSEPQDRTFLGRVYDSKAEMCMAKLLWDHGMPALPQPKVALGPDCECRPDFVVAGFAAPLTSQLLEVVAPDSVGYFYLEVKGYETASWKKNKKLWAKYMSIPLVVVKFNYKANHFEVVEIIQKG